MLGTPYIWSIWSSLSLLYHLFFLVLIAVSIYVVLVATIANVRIRSLGNGDPVAVQRSLEALRAHCANVRQVIMAAFYLFGLLFFVSVQSAQNTLGNGVFAIQREILESFMLHFAVAANVFFVFLVLHVVQWRVCARLNSFERLHDQH